MKGVFVTGTDTDVGKTWVGQKIIQQLCKNGISVEPRKPIESGWPTDITKSDAWKLAYAANQEEKLDVVCPNRFLAAISPDRAAKIEHKLITIQQLSEECIGSCNSEEDFLYVEGAGGFYSPICSDGLNADLAKALNLPIILIAADKLGCINHTLLSIEAIERCGLNLMGVVLNQIDSQNTDTQNMNNFEDLSEKINYPIISTNDSSTFANNICSWFDH
ncbi:dethiobiotin synthase [Cocleimonas flava]|uniref:ATP-dependent dethiobiotin synthetase BioD n=1 Tax=Cocleimonas flava TaxID=634765 RepID=A0A4R1F532_9GAMM|nr:dethiobiotin synthase [Cocleimonas flava]TCJ88963.1 dethiobiotin synthase [Cocleimonas flava]